MTLCHDRFEAPLKSFQLCSFFSENNSHPPAGSVRERAALRRVGARRSQLTLGAHQAVPRDGGEEDRRARAAPRGRVRAAVREDPHPAALPRARHRGAAHPRARLQGTHGVDKCSLAVMSHA